MNIYIPDMHSCMYLDMCIGIHHMHFCIHPSKYICNFDMHFGMSHGTAGAT